MPTDSNGKFQMSGLRPMAKGDGKPMPGKPESKPETGAGKDIKQHMSEMHAADGGKHYHAHHDGMSLKSHHVAEDGKVEGPIEHDSPESMGHHAAQFFNSGSSCGEAGGGPAEDHSLMGGM